MEGPAHTGDLDFTMVSIYRNSDTDGGIPDREDIFRRLWDCRPYSQNYSQDAAQPGKCVKVLVDFNHSYLLL